MSNKYYVYAYLDPRRPSDDDRFSNEPFYIGRGSKSRLNSHINEAKRLPETITRDINKIRSILSTGMTPIIIKLFDGMTMEESKIKEYELIKEIGRSLFGEGPLTNLTEGGEGRHICHAGRFNPFYGKTHTPETRKLISEANKGKTISDTMRSQISTKLTGSKKPAHHGESLRAYRHNLRIKDPMNESFQRLGKLNSKTWEVTSPTGEVFVVTSLRNFCKENGLNVKTLMTAYNQKRSTRDGWSAKLLTDILS